MHLSRYMPCPDYHYIQSRIESAREELRNRAAESASGGESEFAYSAWERVARTSLFSAEIDAQFHRVQCPKCRQMTAPAGQPLASELAKAA